MSLKIAFIMQRVNLESANLSGDKNIDANDIKRNNQIHCC